MDSNSLERTCTSELDRSAISSSQIFFLIDWLFELIEFVCAFQHVVVLVQSAAKKVELEKILVDSGALTKNWIPRNFFTASLIDLDNLVFLLFTIFSQMLKCF